MYIPVRISLCARTCVFVWVFIYLSITLVVENIKRIEGYLAMSINIFIAEDLLSFVSNKTCPDVLFGTFDVIWRMSVTIIAHLMSYDKDQSLFSSSYAYWFSICNLSWPTGLFSYSANKQFSLSLLSCDESYFWYGSAITQEKKRKRTNIKTILINTLLISIVLRTSKKNLRTPLRPCYRYSKKYILLQI